MTVSQRPVYRFLIIEDNNDIAANIGDYLGTLGHIVDFAWDGISGMHLALTQQWDAIVLDIMLPGMDGLTLCRNLRDANPSNRTPILMLTARDTLTDKLAGFDAGTDDYLVKPFAMEELAARLRALIARNQPQDTGVIQIGDLIVNKAAVHVTRNGVEIQLNRACLKILTLLVEAYPNVVRRQEIEQQLWHDEPPDSDALRSHIYQLRSKLDKPFTYPLIHTVHGIGFQLRLPHER